MHSAENEIKAGGPELVFMPGLDGTGLSYGPLGDAMPPDVSLTVIEYPADRELSFEEMVDIAYEQIPHDRPVVLIAESFSGPIAIHMAASLPCRVAGIVFCATFMKFQRRFLMTIARLVPLKRLLMPPVPGFVLYVLCSERAALKKLSPLFRTIEKRLNPAVLTHRIRMLNEIDVIEESRLITVPCCYIQALQDRLVSRKSVRLFRENLRDITIKEVNGPHAILQSRPDECAVIIMEFAERVSRPIPSS